MATRIRFRESSLKPAENFFRGGLMGFQESLNIACLSRKTHGFDKKDCIGRAEAVPGIPLEKKERWKGGKKDKDEGRK